MCQAFSLRSQMSSFLTPFRTPNELLPLSHACDGPGSPNLTSTTVLLTLTVPKPNLPLDHDSCPFPLGESLSKGGGGGLCIGSKQARSVFYLTLSP